LVPPALLTITVVAVGWSLAGWFTPDLRRGTFFAVGQSANWGQILAGQKYGTDAAASPLLHFWSLAIEEQLYLIVPVALLVCGTRRRGQFLVAAALAASVYAIVRSADSATLSYYSTFTRGGEVLVGALAALTMRGHLWSHRATKVVAAVIAMLGMAILTVVATTRNVADPLFSRGGLLACAVLSVIVIVAVVGWPALGRRIDWWPLARLGQISYAVYLFHWPLLQTLRRSNLPPHLVPWATLGMTLVLALASEEWFERPIRNGMVKGPRLVVAAVCTALIVPIVGAVGVSSAGASTDFEAAAAQLDKIIATGPTAPAAPVTHAGVAVHSVPAAVLQAEARWASDGATIPPATTTTVAAEPVRIGFFGDSKALALGLGTANRGFAQISVGTSFTPLGCPVGRGGKVREHAGAMVVTLPKTCDWTDGIAASVGEHGTIDVAVVWSGTWDVNDRKVPGVGGGWTSIADPAYRNWLLGEMLAVTDKIVTVAGAHEVLWLTVPVDPASSHPERFAMWTGLLQELQRMRPGIVQVVDVAAYVDQSGDAHRLLPDGVHPSVGDDDPHGNTGAELTDRLIIPLAIT
jgi:peptidoglycan/LPS O-acetylase OafA/YrhL